MSTEKIERIRSHETFEQLDALFIVKPENALYVLGFKIESPPFIIVPKESPVEVYLDALEYDQADDKISQDEALSEAINVIKKPMGKPKWVFRKVNKKKFKAVGFEDEFLSVRRHEKWMKKFKIVEFVGASEILSDARLIKTSWEIERMERAARFADLGFEAIHEQIKPGMSEVKLAAEAEYAMRRAGAEGTSFDTIVASGEQSGYPHASTSKKKVKNGDLVLVDIGAKWEGYCSDLSRTFILGPRGEEAKELIALVNAGQQHALEHVKAGIQCRDLDKEVRDYFIQHHEEWGKRFIHSLGHGVGIDIHEQPRLSPLSDLTLEENMVTTIEPGLYIPGLGGARTEDMVVVKKEGHRNLSKAPKFHY